MPITDNNGVLIYSKKEADHNSDDPVHGEQLRHAWWSIRRGKPSSSEFPSIITPSGIKPKWTCTTASGSETCGIKHTRLDIAEKCCAGKNRKSPEFFSPAECPMELAEGSESYVNRLIGDSFSLEYPVKEEFDNFHTRRGRRIEPLARRWIEFELNIEAKEVGIMVSQCGRFVSSPDSTEGDDGLQEIKSPAAHTQVEYLRAGTVPDEYLMQVHGQLVVSKRKYVRFVSFHPGLPSLNIVVTPNEITDKLAAALELFWERYQAELSRIRAM